MDIKDFKRPENDSGIGIHLFPHPYVTGDAMDTWIARLVAMKLKWTTMLNEDAASIAKFAVAGIQPVCRPFVRANEDWQDKGIVAEHMVAAGVGPYVQAYNEPELAVEWPGGTVDKMAYIYRWVFAAENIMHHGGYPGIQLLDPEWLRDLLNYVKSAGKEYLFEKVWFACHNYTSNHPTSYPYDALNPGKTIYDDWFAMLSPLKFAKVFRDTIGKDVPIICCEGGYTIGDNADSRYPAVTAELHRDYTVAMFKMFQSGTLPNGEALPDWWFAVTPWLLASVAAGGDPSFEANAWYSQWFGERTLTIEAVKAIPEFVRQTGGTPVPEPTPTPVVTNPARWRVYDANGVQRGAFYDHANAVKQAHGLKGYAIWIPGQDDRTGMIDFRDNGCAAQLTDAEAKIAKAREALA
ncbi:MAG: hypothetical protein Q7O66_16625 [Dehalococcoidia bacterium]|nr:hypothetical protein [Dehalococcoidia bacterium]